MHRQFGSRELIDILGSLGVKHGYNEVKRYVYNLTHEAKRREEEDIAPGENGQPQYGYDNADWNTDTIDGHGTFHCRMSHF